MATVARRPPVEVVALLASAGGLDALSVVLRDLPTEFSAAVVVQQHLGRDTSVLPTILHRLTHRQVSWVLDGQLLPPGQVVVCPPGVDMELMPDGSCRLHRLEGIGTRRFDVLLASMASSYGPRGVAAVLSGSGRDGADGTVLVRRSGGVVIAQSPDTAAYPSMPIAAAKAGADLVVPIHEIGRVLRDIAAGRLPFAPPPPPNPAVGAAGVRAQVAARRAAELRRRRQDLAAGFGATELTVATARCRAAESLRRAQVAHRAACRHAAALRAD